MGIYLPALLVVLPAYGSIMCKLSLSTIYQHIAFALLIGSLINILFGCVFDILGCHEIGALIASIAYFSACIAIAVCFNKIVRDKNNFLTDENLYRVVPEYNDSTNDSIERPKPGKEWNFGEIPEDPEIVFRCQPILPFFHWIKFEHENLLWIIYFDHLHWSSEGVTLFGRNVDNKSQVGIAKNYTHKLHYRSRLLCTKSLKNEGNPDYLPNKMNQYVFWTMFYTLILSATIIQTHFYILVFIDFYNTQNYLITVVVFQSSGLTLLGCILLIAFEQPWVPNLILQEVLPFIGLIGVVGIALMTCFKRHSWKLKFGNLGKILKKQYCSIKVLFIFGDITFGVMVIQYLWFAFVYGNSIVEHTSLTVAGAYLCILLSMFTSGISKQIMEFYDVDLSRLIFGVIFAIGISIAASFNYFTPKHTDQRITFLFVSALCSAIGTFYLQLRSVENMYSISPEQIGTSFTHFNSFIVYLPACSILTIFGQILPTRAFNVLMSFVYLCSVCAVIIAFVLFLRSRKKKE